MPIKSPNLMYKGCMRTSNTILAHIVPFSSAVHLTCSKLESDNFTFLMATISNLKLYILSYFTTETKCYIKINVKT